MVARKGITDPKKGNRHEENQYLATLGIMLFLFCKRNVESELWVPKIIFSLITDNPSLITKKGLQIPKGSI